MLATIPLTDDEGAAVDDGHIAVGARQALCHNVRKLRNSGFHPILTEAFS